MYKKIISMVSLSILFGASAFSQGTYVPEKRNFGVKSYSQENASEYGASYVPKKGSFTISLVLGNNDVTELNADFLPDYNLYNSDLSFSPVGGDSNFSIKSAASITNIAGISLSYFIKDNISLSLMGSYGDDSTPGKDPYTGVTALDGVGVPAFDGIAETSSSQIYVSVGADYHFEGILKNTDFFMGGRFNFMSQNLKKSVFSYLESESVDDEIVYKLMAGNTEEATAETIGFGGSIVAGVNYYINKSLFIGAEFNAFNIMYQQTEIVSRPGSRGTDYEKTSKNAFSFPRLKIGFKIF